MYTQTFGMDSITVLNKQLTRKIYVLVTYCCLTNYHKICQLKIASVHDHRVPEGQDLGSSLAGGSGSESLMLLSSRHLNV